jgi:hypothetical protein
MLTGSLPWSLGLLGNAAFSMVALLVLMASGGRWSLVSVWHAALNAASGLFVFHMVSGDDRARLGLLMSLSYSVVAVTWYLAQGTRLTWGAGPAVPESRRPAPASAVMAGTTPGGTDVR